MKWKSPNAESFGRGQLKTSEEPYGRHCEPAGAGEAIHFLQYITESGSLLYARDDGFVELSN